MKEKIILVGGGGHCKASIDVIEATELFQIAGIVDVPEILHQKVLGYDIIASDADMPRLAKEYKHFLVTVGQIKSPERRIQLYDLIKRTGSHLPLVISPCAHVSKHAIIGEGTIVMHNAVVNPDARIGKNCIVNTKALIEHDVSIGDHCHIATAAIVNGGVQIGHRTFVGSNVVVRENVNIGADCIIGTGETIFKNISSKSKVTTLSSQTS